MDARPDALGLTTAQVILRIAAIIAVVELVIMLALDRLHGFVGTVGEAFVDPVLLIVIATPLIHRWTIKPFVFARDHALGAVTRMAHTDPLTQLANRRELGRQLATSILGHAREATVGALLLIDLDGFKAVNDQRGHVAGDAVLLEIARRLVAASRADDVVSRYGGDEFVVLIGRLDADEPTALAKAQRVAEKLQRVVAEPIAVDGELVQVGASIGIRLIGRSAIDVDTALRDADVAMYRAKHAGRGAIVTF